jgi:hypothetical protein
MGKRKARFERPGARHEDAPKPASQDGFRKFIPLNEGAEATRKAERKVHHIFNSMIGTLRSICDRQMYLPKASKQVSMLHRKYVELYDEFSAVGHPLLPPMSAEKLATMQNYALHEKPFIEFIDYYRSYHLPPGCDVCPDELKQIAKVYYEIQEMSRIVHRFNEVFSYSKKHRVPSGSGEYKALRMWIDWLLDAHPLSGKEPKAVLDSISLAQEMMRPRPQQQSYADARKEGLRILLNKIRRMILKTEELQSIQEEAKQLDDALTSLCNMMGKKESERFRAPQQMLKENAAFYSEGIDGTTRIKGVLGEIRDLLLELWPRD